jgi:hypothetical protein
MKNIIIITSIIDPPKQTIEKSCKMIDYPNKTRSIYSRLERFNQTQKTIYSLKLNIPDVKILLIECSELLDQEKKYFQAECEWVINLFYDEHLKDNIYSQSKSLGEGTMMIAALDFLIRTNIEYDNLFKITGRYWLNENFHYSDFENSDCIFNNDHNASIMIKKNDCTISVSNVPQVVTAFYKINRNISQYLLDFLVDYIDQMELGFQYEKLLGYFLYLFRKRFPITFKSCIGVSGNIAINGFLLNK